MTPVRMRIDEALEPQLAVLQKIKSTNTIVNAAMAMFLRLPLSVQVRVITGDPSDEVVHEITRILDPELTPPPGLKASDRMKPARAKSA